MTDEEKLQHKQKMLSVTMEYITTTFGPNYRNQQVMQHLPIIWNLLTLRGLILPGMNYKMFVHYAQTQFRHAQFQEQMRGILGL